MEKRTLPGSDIKLSQLGFGCAGLMGRLNLRASQRLIDAAFDAGITHFDTARMYGYGEAERALAHILASRRSHITVTSKVGILPPRRSPLVSVARAVARRLVSLQPEMRTAFRRGAEATVQHGVFDIPTLRASLDTSLRELGVDQIDLLLLHECQSSDLEKPELLEFLRTVQREGKVRQYGLATTMADTEACLTVCPDAAPVVQIPSSAWNRNAERLRGGETRGIITHSSLGTRFSDLCSALAEDPLMRRRWSERLGFDVGQRRALGAVFLRYAIDSNPNGTVLFSSTDPRTIQSNVRVIQDAATSGQVNALIEFLGEGTAQ